MGVIRISRPYFYLFYNGKRDIMAGTIVDLGNNKWELRVSLGYDTKGKQVRKTKRISARSKTAAQKELAKFYVEVTNRPVIKGDKITFGNFVDLWIERHASKLSNTTYNRNIALLNTRILPAFERKNIDRISDMDILRFVETLKKVGMRMDGKDDIPLSAASVKMHYKLLRSILNKAVQWKYLSQNPCELITKEDIPKAKYRRLPIWQEEDLRRFLKLVEELDDSPLHTKYKLIVSISSLTGMRRGEFMALTWDCIDFANKRILVNKACEIIPYKPVGVKLPKTAESIRWLGIDDYIIELLKKHKYYQEQYLEDKKYTNPRQFVFIERVHTSDTREVRQAFPTCFSSWLRKFSEKHELPKITVHSFRHMAGTYALAYGVPLTTVQHMLGHTDIKTTSIYLHDLEAKNKEATEVLSARFKEFRE